ncbi:MAG: hypothetical protein ACFFE8_09790 [Candidatus Heimdallarchaeota archaeon]
MNVLEFEQYSLGLRNNINAQLTIASKARARKYDPMDSVESRLTFSSKENILAILNIPGLDKHLPQYLFSHENALQLAAEVAKQIVNERFVKLPPNQLIRLAIHSALVILSRGLISIPQEIIPKIFISNRTNHLTLFFSNTVRYVRGDIIGLVILTADYIRKLLHIERFRPSPALVSRYIEEMELFLTLIDRSQDLRRDLVETLIQSIGVEITGEPSERIEVRRYRNLPNIHNQLRMGMCVTLEKIMDNINVIAEQRTTAELLEWEWLKPHVTEKREKLSFSSRDARGTRPLLSRSKTPGGFRLRYGIARNTGQGAVGIHPATMHFLELLSPGTNVIIDVMDRPITLFPVSSLLGPYIELRDGSTIRIESDTDFRDLKDKIKLIWEMGDLLLSPDDIPATETIEQASWTEEWWSQEVYAVMNTQARGSEFLAAKLAIPVEMLKRYLESPILNPPPKEVAVGLSRLTNTPLHPYYSFNWNEIAIGNLEKLLLLINKSNSDLIPYDTDMIKILSKLGVPFTIEDDKLRSPRFDLFVQALSGKKQELTQILLKSPEPPTIEEILSQLIGIQIKSLCHRRIGLKLLRVEKAELRHLNPPAHVLFPIGSYGGTQKDILKAANESTINVRLAERYCASCEISTFQVFCPQCDEQTDQHYVCRQGHISAERNCTTCGQYAFPSHYKPIHLATQLESAFQLTGEVKVDKIKGVASLNSRNHIPEHLAKGILRAKYDLLVYKDGTSRFEMTNAPLTHFTPKEINTSISDLKLLGYSHDVYGEDLTDEDQMVELFPFDVIINQSAGDFLIKQTKLVDDELSSLYSLPRYYRRKTLETLVGTIIVGLSPFSAIAVVGRVIGYIKHVNVLLAHPLWHNLKTRNCNGDVDSITLLLDVLLNFSTEFYPTQRGGSMDIPMIVHFPESWEGLSLASKYTSVPLNLPYYRSLNENPLREDLMTYEQSYLAPSVPKIHTIDNYSSFRLENQFKTKTIISKVESILKILPRIRGIEESDFVDGILQNDFMIKTSNSMNRFFLQPFRCKRCKTVFRRIPLSSLCSVCHSDLISLSLSAGWVVRLLHIIEQLQETYNTEISTYSKAWIRLVNLRKQMLFDRGPRPTRLI